MSPLRSRHHLHRLRAIVLKRTPVREKDRIVEVFSREEGRVRLFAPGVRHVSSRRAGHLEPLMETALVVARSAKGLAIREARALHTFPNLREHYARIRQAYDIAHLLYEFTGDGVHDPALYDAVVSVLRALDDRRALPPLLRESVELHLLRSLGAFPDLYRCSNCRAPLRPGAFSLRSPHRGFWGDECGGRRDRALTNVVKVLRLMTARPVLPRTLEISSPVAQGVRSVLRSLLRSQAGILGVHSRR